MKKLLSVFVALGVAPAALMAQAAVDVRTSALYESYKFEAGLPFCKISEFTIPVGVTFALGRFGSFSVSSGYASVELISTDPAQLPDQTVSGMLDTETRLTVNLVPGRLVALLTGVFPTGVKTVLPEELSILGAITSDVIGFSTSDLGTGGGVGGGFAGAVPVGKMALGFGATYRHPLSYQPIAGQTSLLLPGPEVLIRGGLEGSIARRTYVRIAGIFARRMKDQIDGVYQNGVGNRFIGYLSLDQGIGRSTITVYGFDVFRADPQIEPTAAGAALLPRGNLLAFGGQISLPIGRSVSFIPRGEFRLSHSAPDTVDTQLQRLGDSFRFGADVRIRAHRNFAFVLYGGGFTGTAYLSSTQVGVTGFRAAVHLEVTR